MVEIKGVKSTLLNYQVIKITALAKDISQIIVKASTASHIKYEAGQYAIIVHDDGIESPMSIACAPVDAAIIEFHLHHPAENLQALDLLRLAKMDKGLMIQGPFGRCTASTLLLDRPIIFIANGTGLAPIKAVMEELLQIKNLPPIYLYCYDEESDQPYLNDLILEWQRQIKNFHFFFVSSQQVIEAVLKDHQNLSAYQVYAVDAPQEVLKILNAFLEKGLEREHFYSDGLDYL